MIPPTQRVLPSPGLYYRRWHRGNADAEVDRQHPVYGGSLKFETVRLTGLRQEIVFLLCIENSEGYLEEAVALSGISCDNMMIIESDSIRQFD